MGLHLALAATACGPCQKAGPTSPAAQPAWLEILKAERETVLAKIGLMFGHWEQFQSFFQMSNILFQPR